MPFVMALLSSVLYGTADFLGGIGSRRGPAVAVTAWFQLVGLLFLLVYAMLAPGVTRATDLMWGAAAGASGGVGVLLLYRALAGGIVSTAAPLISMVALSVPVAVGLAGGERPGLLPLIGVGVGCVAVTLISAHGDARDEAAPRRGRLMALTPAIASGVLIGVFLVCLARVQAGASGWALVAGRGTATLLLFAMVFASRTPVRPPAATHAPIVGAAVTDVAANVLYLLAVQRGPLSLIATLVSLAPATTVLLAQLVLRERLGVTQRWGVALALLAVVLLSRG
jgi:uncharacterized membrane protein